MKSRFLKFVCVFLCFITALTVTAFAGVTYKSLPATAEEAGLLWSAKLGTSYRNAPSVPTACGSDIIVMSGSELIKLDGATGEILKKAQMCSEPSFGYTPVLCADGKLFCPLDGGTVQAFDAETLTLIWSFSASSGGQALSPITYSSGRVYTGFWNDEEADADFVCLDAESGELCWSKSRKGGYYWAEAYVSGNRIVVGGDSGSGSEVAEAAVICYDKSSGKELGRINVIGDVRSGIGEGAGSLYFVTKAGYICKASLLSDGSFGNVTSKKLAGASTSTPVVYGGNVYVGIQSSGFSGGISILDAQTLETVKTVPMRGYPQSEIVVSPSGGTVNLYSTYNSAPGGIAVVNDALNANSAAEDLFVPESGAQGYCISPICVTDDGAMVYKNDSGTVFAVSGGASAEKTVLDLIVELFTAIIKLIMQIMANI